METNNKQPKREKKQSVLEVHDFVDSYAKDMLDIRRMPVSENTKLWITERVVEMQMKSSKAEKFFGEILVSKNILFKHKAPFVFSGFAKPEIKFADFFFPKFNTVVEINSHDGEKKLDKDRSDFFKRKGIKVVSISSADAMSEAKVNKLLATIGL